MTQNSRYYLLIVKPFLDVLISVVVVVLASPAMLSCILVLAIVNRGKVWFVQERPGKHGKLFRIIKLKTMTDRRDARGVLLPDKDRLTFVGNVIRKLSLDELPQLMNVITGDMSMVGPRPLLPEYLPLYSAEQARRHLVKPGITGWAQVNGRNAISWGKKFEYDVWYVDHVSFTLDFKILFLTLLKVIKRTNIHADGHVTIEKFKGNYE